MKTPIYTYSHVLRMNGGLEVFGVTLVKSRGIDGWAYFIDKFDDLSRVVSGRGQQGVKIDVK